MMLSLRPEHENGLEYRKRQREEIVRDWYPQSGFQADPGASFQQTRVSPRHHPRARGAPFCPSDAPLPPPRSAYWRFQIGWVGMTSARWPWKVRECTGDPCLTF